jgi:hypothetical protein
MPSKPVSKILEFFLNISLLQYEQFRQLSTALIFLTVAPQKEKKEKNPLILLKILSTPAVE